MKKKYYRLIILFLFLGFSNVLVSQGAKESKEVDLSYEEFKAMRKKEQENKKAQEKEQEYRDYVEFQEFKRKKAGESLEEQEMEKKRNEGKIAYSPWAVQYLATSGYVGESNGRTGRSGQFLVSAEYHEPTSKLGFRLGLSSWNYNYSGKIQKLEKDFLTVFFVSQGNLFPFLIIEPFVNRNAKISGNSLDFHIDYHFKPRQFVDPYIFGGAGIGICERQCNAIKIAAGGGVRINIKVGYFLSEIVFEKPFFAFSPDDQTAINPNLYMAGIRVGFGMFL
jgi:hypothetical protein